MSAPELAGVLPVLATPFTADLDLDLESLAKLTQWQVDAGAGGVAVFGFASEGFALSGPERGRIISVVREVLPPALPLIAGVSATGTAEAVALAAGLQVAAAVDNLLAFEFQPDTLPMANAILRTPIQGGPAEFTVPDGPGLGIEVDRDAVEQAVAR